MKQQSHQQPTKPASAEIEVAPGHRVGLPGNGSANGMTEEDPRPGAVTFSASRNGRRLSAAQENRREAARHNGHGASRDTDIETNQHQPSRQEVARVVTRVLFNVWLLVGAAARKVGRSEDTIERRGVPWVDHYIPFRVRYKFQVLDKGAEAIKVYLEEDLEKLMVAPADLPRGTRTRFIPRFVRRKR